MPIPIKKLFQIMDVFAEAPVARNIPVAPPKTISAPKISSVEKIDVPAVEVGKEFVTPGGLRLKIESLAGEGRRGKVYRAIEMSSREAVALKILRCTEAKFLRSIALETSKAETLAKSRIACAAIMEAGTTFVVKEWVDGISGEDWARSWRNGGMDLSDPGFAALLRFFRNSAVKGVCIHNLKPANMIFSSAAGWIPIDPGRIDAEPDPVVTLKRYREKFLRNWLGVNRLLFGICNFVRG